MQVSDGDALAGETDAQDEDGRGAREDVFAGVAHSQAGDVDDPTLTRRAGVGGAAAGAAAAGAGADADADAGTSAASDSESWCDFAKQELAPTWSARGDKHAPFEPPAAVSPWPSAASKSPALAQFCSTERSVDTNRTRAHVFAYDDDFEDIRPTFLQEWLFRMPSPTRGGHGHAHPHPNFASNSNLPPPPATALPRKHRPLRKLQSAQNLSQHQPSALSALQPRLRDLHEATGPAPARRHASTAATATQRHRANSDAPSPAALAQNSAMPVSRQRAALSKTSAVADSMSLERLIRDGPPDGDVKGALESTRLKVLDQGIKADSDGMSSVRIYVWLILLDAPILKTDAYLDLIHRGASPAYSKIRNDTFRTLTTDPLFRRRVSEASLIRLLNAIAWKLHDAKEESRPPSSGSRSSTAGTHRSRSPAAKNRARALTLTTEGSDAGHAEPGTYVQGMNVLAAPFLYAARSEAEAFVAFHRLLTKECPGYIRGAMDGVHRGLTLVDKVLAVVDPKLNLYLISKGLSAEIYAFPSVLTLCACTPPLPEVLRLWDFLFAYGPHLNILCIVAQLIVMRNDLLNSTSPNKLLRSFPPLQAEHIKRTALAIMKMIPDSVYAEIIAHAR